MKEACSAWRQHGDVGSASRQHCGRTDKEESPSLRKRGKKKRREEFQALFAVCVCCYATAIFFIVSSSFVIIILYFYVGFLSSRQTRSYGTPPLALQQPLDEYVDS